MRDPIILTLPAMAYRALVVLALIAACSGQPRRLLHPTDPSTDFYQVSPGIYRGGRLDQAGVFRLKAQGFKTILNLENDRNQIVLESVWAKSAGLTQLPMPLSGFFYPEDEDVQKILQVLADPSKRPIYVHCKKGMDRTGIVIALHRVYNEGWTLARAEAERDALGFNPWLTRLDHYFDWKAAHYHPVARHLDEMVAGGGGGGGHTESRAAQ